MPFKINFLKSLHFQSANLCISPKFAYIQSKIANLHSATLWFTTLQIWWICISLEINKKNLFPVFTKIWVYLSTCKPLFQYSGCLPQRGPLGRLIPSGSSNGSQWNIRIPYNLLHQATSAVYSIKHFPYLLPLENQRENSFLVSHQNYCSARLPSLKNYLFSNHELSTMNHEPILQPGFLTATQTPHTRRRTSYQACRLRRR